LLSPQQAQTAGGLEEAETTLNPNGYIITQSTSEATGNTISIGTSTTVTLQDTNITSNGEWAAEITNLSTVNLILEGTNILRSDTEPGLSLLSGNTAIISGPGELFAYGGTGGAGIGGGASSGTLIINSGSVSALGGSFAAGIGGGWAEDGANGGTVTINGGSVNAISNDSAPGIGHGEYRSYNGTLKNGDGEDVVLTTVTLHRAAGNAAVSSLAITAPEGGAYSYGTDGMKADTDGRLYLYLPAGAIVTGAAAEDQEYGISTVAAGASGTLYPEGYTYTITASAGTGGSISPDGAVYVTEEDTAKFTFTPDPGCILDKVYIDGAETTVTDNSYTFSGVTGDHTLNVTFNVFHTINATSNSKGSISPAGGVQVPDGDNETFTFEPHAGHVLYKLYIDGVDTFVEDDSYTFTEVTAPHSIHAFFRGAEEEGSPTVLDISTGSIEITGDGAKVGGTSVEGVLNPDGYIITQSNPAAATGNTVRVNVSTSVTLDNVNISAAGWGSYIAPGAAANLALEGINTLRGGNENPGLYVPVGAEVVINGPGELRAYGAEWGAGIGGSATNSCGKVVINGGSVSAYAGYAGAGIGGGINAGHGSIRINGGSVRAIGGYITPAVSGTPMPAPYNTAGAPLYLTTVTLDGLTEATPVSSLLTLSGFAPFTYGTTGMKTDAGGKLYLYLPSGIRTIAADTENGPFGGNIINSGTSGSLYAPSEGGILAYAVSPGGSFDPDGSIPAEYGEDVTIDFVPAAGYGLAHLYVDCAEVDIEGDSYTFGNVSEPHVITGFFISNTITASSGFGGSISPSGAVPVGYGRDITFTFEANDG
jgi:hypothetical protein